MMFRAATADRGELSVLLCERGENIVLDEGRASSKSEDRNT